MNNLVFDPKKIYLITFIRGDQQLTFTAHDIQYIGSIISFTDKYNQHLAFPDDAFYEAHEVKP